MLTWLPLLPLLLTAVASDPAPSDATAAPATVRVEGPLRFEDIPPVDADLAARLDRFQQIRSAGFHGFVGGKDSRGLFISTRFGEVSQLHEVNGPGAARTQRTFAPEPVASVVAHPHDPDKALVVRDVGGNEAYQVFLWDRTTGQTSLLTDGQSRHGSAKWSDDPSQPTRYAYTSTERNSKDYDLYVRSLGGEPELVYEGSGYHGLAAFSDVHDVVLLHRYVSITRSSLHQLLPDGTLKRLTPTGEVSIGSAVLGPDGRTAYVTSDHEGDFLAPYALDVPTAKLTRLPVDLSWDVVDLAVSNDGRTLALTANERGWQRLYTFDLRKQRLSKPTSLPDGMVSGITFDPHDPRRLGLALSGPDRPGDVWTLDVRRDRATRWTHSETAGLTPSDFVTPRTLTWTSFDGLELDGFAYDPDGPGPHPVVVLIHGGPEAQSRPYLSGWAQVLAREGIAVVVPNVRGSRGYGKTFVALDNVMKREDSVRDIGTLLDWIATQPQYDADRVAVRGGSYGGYMVLASMIHHGDRLRGGINVVGISHFVTFLENTKAYRRDLRRVEYGDERDPEVRAFLDEISPLTQASRIQGRLFVIHGANDPRVPVSEAEQIVAAVRERGETVWYLRAENEGHGFRKKANRDTAQVLEVQFLLDLLAGE